MAIPGEANARIHGGPRRQEDERHVGPGTPSLALASLDRALLTARRLRETLDTAARQQAELATLLARALALAGLCTTPSQICAAGLPPVRPLDALSPREADVLRLLASGQSNRRIAATLFLSPRTVQRHVANAYLKIGAHCRAEATAYALRHRLA